VSSTLGILIYEAVVLPASKEHVSTALSSAGIACCTSSGDSNNNLGPEMDSHPLSVTFALSPYCKGQSVTKTKFSNKLTRSSQDVSG